LVTTLGLFTLFDPSVLAGGPPQQQPSSSPPPHWNVRLELLVVDMPQAKALSLLTDLRDPVKIDAADAEILAAVGRNEATLVGYPVIHVIDGQRGVSEPMLEKRYPTEFSAPLDMGKPVHALPAESPPPGYPPSPQLPANPLHDVSVPTAFETRNVGLTLEAEVHVLKDAKWILLDIVPSHTILHEIDTYVTQLTQPQFICLKSVSEFAVRNGQRTLVSFNKIPEVDNQIEVDIVQAWAEPIQ